MHSLSSARSKAHDIGVLPFNAPQRRERPYGRPRGEADEIHHDGRPSQQSRARRGTPSRHQNPRYFEASAAPLLRHAFSERPVTPWKYLAFPIVSLTASAPRSCSGASLPCHFSRQRRPTCQCHSTGGRRGGSRGVTRSKFSMSASMGAMMPYSRLGASYRAASGGGWVGGGVGISFATAREGVRAACVGGVRSAPPGSASRRSYRIRLTSLNRQLGTRINHLHLSSLRYASPRSAQPKAKSFFSFIPSYLLLYCSKLNTLIPRTFCLPGGRRMTGTRAGNGRRPRKNHQRTGSQHIDEIEDFRSPNRRAIGRELGDNWSVGGRAKISQQ